MEKVINILNEWIEKIGTHNILLVLFIFAVTLTAGLYTTFSIYTTTETPEIIDGLTTYKFILNEEKHNNTVKIAANSTKNLDITVSNSATTKLKYGVYYFSNDDLTNVTINYLPTSAYKTTGIIEANTDYIITIKIINNSTSAITINFGLSFGLENGGELILDSDKKWVPETTYLNKATIGSYVEYIGNNGCDGNNCSGENANKNELNNGYCQNENYQYNQNGWRIAYIENDNVYLISAGAPECLCTNSNGSKLNSACENFELTEGIPLHLKNANEIALKYCNPAYVQDEICDNETAWAMNENDFNKITGNNSKNCYDSINDTMCGYENDLIDIGGEYWLATPTTNVISPSYHIQNWLALERTISDNTSNNSYGIRPIIKLDKKVFITDGKGTIEKPYIISNQ